MRDLYLSLFFLIDFKLDDEKFEVMLICQDFNNFFFLLRKVDLIKYCKYYLMGGNCGKWGKCCFVYDVMVCEVVLRECEMNGGCMILQ